MKKNMNKTRARQMTRREFVAKTFLTAGMLSGAPAFLRGQHLNNKLNIAFIACGGRGTASLGELTLTPGSSDHAPADKLAGSHPDENVAVLCDVNQVALDSASHRYPKAKCF